jgi:riboflavin biosynthesis pyrimidine reductase
MKPYVTVHMMSSIDGRIDVARWQGDTASTDPLVREYETVHDLLGASSWIVGRRTMQEFTTSPPFDAEDLPLPRTTYNAAPDATSFAIVIDPTGKLTWDRADINGDRIIEILTERVSDRYLNHLRHVGISYLFGGTDGIDLNRVLSELNHTFGIDRLLVEGGGILNGTFLAAGVVDEISLLITPVADGSGTGPTTFDHSTLAIPATGLRLHDVQRRDNGVVWLRYGL